MLSASSLRAGIIKIAIVIGILIVFFVNLQIQRLGDETWNLQTGWRWMFASLAAPAAQQERNRTSLLIGILIFVVAFAISTGPITWILNSEIFPTKLRAQAMSVAIICPWVADWAVTQTFPMLRASIRPAKTF